MNGNLPIEEEGAQCVLPVLTYGAGAWRRTKHLERQPRSAQRGMERKMLCVTWRDRKRASWISEQTETENIKETTKKVKWAWAGHVMCRTDNSWTTKVTEWQPRNCSSRGRQRTR